MEKLSITARAVLNLPWTVLGLVLAAISIPVGVTLSYRPLAIICRVRSLNWYHVLAGKTGSRAITLGYTVVLSPTILPGDLEHELVHVDQYRQRPFVQAFLYGAESLRHGYRANRYEIEAYERAGNRYIESPTNSA